MNVGDNIRTTEEQDALPPGSTVVENVSGMVWTRLSEDALPHRWVSATGSRLRRLANGDTNRVTYIAGAVVNEEPPPESIAAFKARVGSILRGGTQRAGVSNEPIRLAVERFGLAWPVDERGNPIIRPGMVISPNDPDVRIPTGTLCSQWESRRRTIFKYGSYESLFGAHTYDDSYPVTILAMPDGDTERWEPERGENEAEAMANLRSRLWQFGMAAKRRHDWCGEYERVMERAGLSAATCPAMPGTIGSLMSREDVANKPQGSLFIYDDTLYMRDNSATNAARTRRVSLGDGQQPRGQALYAGSNVGDLNDSGLLTVALLDKMPMNTEMRYAGSTRYVRVPDDRDRPRWKENGEVPAYAHTSDAFQTQRVVLTSLPGVTDFEPKTDEKDESDEAVA